MGNTPNTVSGNTGDNVRPHTEAAPRNNGSGSADSSDNADGTNADPSSQDRNDEETANETTRLMGKKVSFNRTTSEVDTRLPRRLRSESSFLNTSLRRILDEWTTSQRREALRRPNVGTAALLVRDAVLGQEPLSEQYDDLMYDPYKSSESGDEYSLLDSISIICGRISSYDWVVTFVRLSAWSLALLTFFEPPHWCRRGIDTVGIPFDEMRHTNGVAAYKTCQQLLLARGAPAGDDNSTELAEYYPSSSSVFLDAQQAIYVEACLVSVIAAFILLRFARNGCMWFIHFQRNSQGIQRLIQFVGVTLIYIGLALQYTRFHPYWRLAVLGTFHSSFQREFRAFFRMIPDILYILALLFVVIFFYAWFGTVIFYGTDQGVNQFPNLIDSLWTLWQMVTTVNYPDVMMDAYNKSRLTGLYFVSFMVISLFFIINLILASVVNAYNRAIEQRKKNRDKHAKGNLTKAFQLVDVDNNGYIDSETIMAMFYVLNNDFPDFHYIDDEQTRILFAVLDKDGSSQISLEEFLDFGNVLLLELHRATDYITIMELHFPSIYHSDWYQNFSNFVKSAAFDVLVDAVLVLNAVVIGIQCYPELAGLPVDVNPSYTDGAIDTIWETFETVFTILYVLEAIVKVLVFGRKAYMESPRNVFDLIVTVCSVAATIYVYYPNGYYDSRLIRLIVMARVLRLLRLLFAVPQFQLIGRISAEIIPAAGSVLLFLFFLLYFFAAVGMSFFGGIITRDPANPLSEKILGTPFAEADYWANNFNDMFSAMNVLFDLLVVNNWMVIELSMEQILEHRWVRLYFLAFHLFGVILVNNLVQAVVINAFVQQLENSHYNNSDEVIGGEAVIRKQMAVFNASEVTGTKTGASGDYVARIHAVHSDIDLDERDRLRKLFTQSSRSSRSKSDSEDDKLE